MELTILMPCLNEAETIATCVRKARGFLDRSGIDGEVLIADNGSTDGSRDIAKEHGARIVNVVEPGYGAALLGGIAAARGRFVIMGDADDSYDFSNLQPFVDRLRDGADLVMGNRFKGGIKPGAMPLLNRYLGNPILSFIGRLFFRIKIGDFHCGLRGFDRERILALDLRTTGMEFASEVVVRSALAEYSIAEVPTTLSPDGRSRPPHLRPWRDGWRHLRFLLIYSPRWLFLYPGMFLILAALAGIVWLLRGPVQIGAVAFDINSFMVCCFALLIGLQSVTFGILARRIGMRRGLLPARATLGFVLESFTLERMLVVALVFVAAGAAGALWVFGQWATTAFGDLISPMTPRVFALSLTGIAAGFLLGFNAFLASVIDLATK
jgi:glycosyltransferase involved in cell wall biosynthesis